MNAKETNPRLNFDAEKLELQHIPTDEICEYYSPDRFRWIRARKAMTQDSELSQEEREERTRKYFLKRGDIIRIPVDSRFINIDSQEVLHIPKIKQGQKYFLMKVLSTEFGDAYSVRLVSAEYATEENTSFQETLENNGIPRYLTTCGDNPAPFLWEQYKVTNYAEEVELLDETEDLYKMLKRNIFPKYSSFLKTPSKRFLDSQRLREFNLIYFNHRNITDLEILKRRFTKAKNEIEAYKTSDDYDERYIFCRYNLILKILDADIILNILQFNARRKDTVLGSEYSLDEEIPILHSN